MRFNSITLLILISLFFACQDEDNLLKVCVSQNQPCFIQNDNIVIGNDIKLLGQCKTGKTSCNKEKEIICIDYVGPSAEICDHLDNDCDGEVDEEFDQDRDGFTSCGGDCDDASFRIHPNAEEICDNIDNNCDGNIDEISEECWTGNRNSVFNEHSTCRKGTKICEAGRWGSCMDQVLPQMEACDMLDNDCDGEIDEVVVGQCGPDIPIGQCRRGDQVCINGETQCLGAVYAASEEICDNIDNDCDGDVDEDLHRLCQTECGYGEEYCADGGWYACSAPLPTEEVCDDIDNDCDGAIDEDCLCDYLDTQICRGNASNPILNPTNNSTISCGVGVQVCNLHGEWGPCNFIGSIEEQCNNWDDDCDGIIDDINLICGDILLAGIGECRSGLTNCSAGVWSECVGVVAPTEEICDMLDNDCDGEIDEGLTPHDKVDILFIIDGSGSMCSVMNALRQGLANYVAEFQGSEHRFGIMMFPGNTSNSPIYDIITIPPLTDINNFQNALSSISCTRGGIEPSYDAMHIASKEYDPAGIGWRSDAYPYIILITDEPAQTNIGTSESDVAFNCNNCAIGMCGTGDRIETYVITQGMYSSQWDEPTYFESDRIVEIYPVNGRRYTDLLRNIFSNICI